MSSWITSQRFYTGRTSGAGTLIAASDNEPPLQRGVLIKCLSGTPVIRHVEETSGTGYPLSAGETVTIEAQKLSDVEQVGSGTLAYIGS